MSSSSDLIEIARCRALLGGGCPGPAGPPGPPGPAGSGVAPLYGAFISMTRQVGIDATTPVAITYTSRTAGTINVVGAYPTSQISIPTAGTYKVLFSAQTDTISGNHYVEVWPVINGTSVPDSNTRIRMQNQIENCLTVEYFLSFAANDILEFYFIGDSPDAILETFSADPSTTPAKPAIPSIIVTIMRIE